MLTSLLPNSDQSPGCRSRLRPSCDAPHRDANTLAKVTSSLTTEPRELPWRCGDIEPSIRLKVEELAIFALVRKSSAARGLISIRTPQWRPRASLQAAIRSCGR